MTELKTLKDLQIGTLHLEEGKIKLTDIVSHKMLKQEAIKWVKVIQNKKTNETFRVIDGYNAIQEWIKKFFNITEEDLNEWKKHELGDPQTSTGK